MSQNANIENLIPQRPPFVMVEKLLGADERKADSSFTVTDENVLVDDRTFTEAGIIENIAQTAALHAGYLADKAGLETPQGMIGAIKNLEIVLLPKINETINTTVTVEHEVMNAKIVKGEVYQNNKLIAQCEMKVFLF